MKILNCLGLSEQDLQLFTSASQKPASQPHTSDDISNRAHVHVVQMGTCGETWPYFRPNFVAMHQILEVQLLIHHDGVIQSDVNLNRNFHVTDELLGLFQQGGSITRK